MSTPVVQVQIGAKTVTLPAPSWELVDYTISVNGQTWRCVKLDRDTYEWKEVSR